METVFIMVGIAVAIALPTVCYMVLSDGGFRKIYFDEEDDHCGEIYHT